MQHCSNSSALAMELLQSCAKPLTWPNTEISSGPIWSKFIKIRNNISKSLEYKFQPFESLMSSQKWYNEKKMSILPGSKDLNLLGLKPEYSGIIGSVPLLLMTWLYINNHDIYYAEYTDTCLLQGSISTILFQCWEMIENATLYFYFLYKKSSVLGVNLSGYWQPV